MFRGESLEGRVRGMAMGGRRGGNKNKFLFGGNVLKYYFCKKFESIILISNEII